MIKIFATYYKQEKELNVLLSALAVQSNQNFELTVCSNGDHTLPEGNYERIVTEENTGFWGCLNRKNFIASLDDEDYVINTSVEDYYTPNMIAEVEECIKSGFEFIFWDVVHHHYKYTYLRSMPMKNYIDWGNFCVKAKYIKQVEINHESFFADGETVEAIMELNPKAGKINKVLMVKN
jgi:hypothetical protein